MDIHDNCIGSTLPMTKTGAHWPSMQMASTRGVNGNGKDGRQS